MVNQPRTPVVILCGGKGTRIRDVSEDIPKPMIQIGERPILWHLMKGYAEQGFNDFILCLGYKSWVIKRYFLDYHLATADLCLSLRKPAELTIRSREETEDWNIALAETGLETMTGGRVKRIEPYITSEHFMLTYGDAVADIDLNELYEFHKRHGRVATVTAVRPPGRFGEIEVNAGEVTEFNEKPVVSRGWINGGFFVLNRSFFQRLTGDPGIILEHEPLMGLARDGQLMAYEHDGFWHPMDTSRDHKVLNDMWGLNQAPWTARWSNPSRSRAA